MNKFYLFCLLLLLPISLMAQTIRGHIQAEGGRPVEGATIVAYNKADVKMQSVTSNAAGQFTINNSVQTAYLYITHVGYMPYRQSQLRDSIIIVLKPKTQQLAEVNIKAERPLIEQQFDRMLLNVDGNPKAGMNAIDILRKAPGVAIVNNTELKLEGKSVTVYLDGKPTRLSGADLMNLLNNTNYNRIAQVELLYNPSAKYDAQGDGGIINIKTIKLTKPGYDADISLSGGHGWKYFSNNNISGDLNYREGNNYWYGSYSYGQGHQSQEIQTNTYLQDINQRLLDSTVYSTPYHSQNLRLGWDHYLNKKDVVGFLLTAYDSRSETSRDAHTGIFALQGTRPDSTRYSQNYSPRTSRGANLNLNYKVVLDSVRQRELTMDADAGIFHYQNDNMLQLVLKNDQGTAISPVQTLDQLARTRTAIFSYKADHTQKFYKGNLDVGIKAGYINVDNDFDSPGNTNTFIYKETVLAAYGSTKQVIGKLTIQAGLRAEQTYTTGNSVTIGNSVDRSYLSLFPNIISGYKFNKSLLSLSYSRRIGRPAYNYLNPFRIVQNAYTVFEGNPYLKPSFADNYRLGYTLLGKYSFALSYSQVHDVITDLRLVDEQTKISTGLKANLNSNHNMGFNAGYSDKLFGVLNVNYSATLAYNRYSFIYQTLPVEVKQLTASTYLDNQVNLPKDWWFDVYLYAQSRVTYGNQINLPMAITTFSTGKKVLKGKGNLSLAINDPFFTGIQRSEASYGNVNYNNRSQYDSRNVRLNFTYNFGNAKVNVRNRSSGSADEQRRTQ